jgi:energy-coupling factor transporter transmembrane protein EcfT
VAEALESRAFGSNNERTYYFSIKFRSRDWIFTSYLLLILAIFIIIRLNFAILPPWLLWSFPL